MITDKIELSSEFKSQTTKAIFSIIIFLITYIVLFAFAVCLTIGCLWAAAQIVIGRPSFITLMLGIGIASLGFLVLFFLIKFLFNSHKVDRSHLVEIKKEEEPELFKMIEDIVLQVGTTFPKKVYLSADVNASVFYDSSFWSMFMPIRKNLQIGLGLVNSVTKEELKAILAHEFGHFSQKTMKVGSYVYNVNQVIHNMLYDNTGYENTLNQIGEASGYFTLFVMLAHKIVQMIQWILKRVYDFVNISYMALSREMEFHADEIAANVTGFEPLKNSLLRLSFADHSFNSVLNYYENKLAQNVKSDNIFAEHSVAFKFLAKENNLPISNDFPEVSVEELSKFNKSKLVIEDQWASHPSTEERVARLEQTKLNAPPLTNLPANSIFKNITSTQQKLTELLFKGVKFEGEVTSNAIQNFEKEFKNKYLESSFPKIYNGYYDAKNLTPFDFEKSVTTHQKLELTDLFSDEKIDLIHSESALKNDIETIKIIKDQDVKIKTFDYDGVKYHKKEIVKLIPKLESTLESFTIEVAANDANIFHFFSEKETDGSGKLKKMYTDFFEFDKTFDNDYKLVETLREQLQFVNYTLPYDQIISCFISLKPNEKLFRANIAELLEDEIFKSAMTSDIREQLEFYLSKEWEYFQNETYYEKSLQVFYAAINNYTQVMNVGYTGFKKVILDYQESLLLNA